MTYNLKLMEYYVTGGLPTTVLWSHRPPIGGGECKPVGDQSEIRKSVRSWAWPRGRGCMPAMANYCGLLSQIQLWAWMDLKKTMGLDEYSN